MLWKAFASVIDFHPHRGLASGHAQTLAAFLVFARTYPESARRHHVALDDGDQLVLHDDCPSGWQRGNRTAVIVHGVCGCHGSSYCVRAARRLNEAGVRTFRVDLRGCGAGEALARRSYHGGCSGDLLAAVRWVERECPASPISLVGFSLGGNISLKMLGESPADVPEAVDRAMAISPPIDILQTSLRMQRGASQLYGRYFSRLLYRHLLRRRTLLPDLVDAPFARVPRSVWEFDEAFTARVAGFGTAENYYRLCSSAPVLHAVRVPTLILASADDPLVPAGPYQSTPLSTAIRLCLTAKGGHLGFLSRRNGDPDRHWMDWRILEWCGGR